MLNFQCIHNENEPIYEIPGMNSTKWRGDYVKSFGWTAASLTPIISHTLIIAF